SWPVPGSGPRASPLVEPQVLLKKAAGSFRRCRARPYLRPEVQQPACAPGLRPGPREVGPMKIPKRMRKRSLVMVGALAAALLAVALLAGGCGSKGEAEQAQASGSLVFGASLSLTGALAREGTLTMEGYDVCRNVVNDKGGVDVGGRKLTLDIRYQDDTSKPDTAAQLVDQDNDAGVKLILGPYGSANTGSAAAVVERNGQVM